MSDITNSAGTLASPHHRSNSPTKRTLSEYNVDDLSTSGKINLSSFIYFMKYI